jgi:hypothetical protein
MGQAKQRRRQVEALHASVSARFPALRAFSRNRRLAVEGVFPIEHEGRELDRFAIDVDFGHAEAGKLPVVRETGSRIPRSEARHVNGDGSACVCMPEHYFLRNPGPFDILTFLDGPVRDFFLGQIMVEAGDPWPFGEWAHGADGQDAWLREFAASLTDRQRDAYASALAGPRIEVREPCPCESGRTTGACHVDLLTALRALPQARAAPFLAAVSRGAINP